MAGSENPCDRLPKSVGLQADSFAYPSGSDVKGIDLSDFILVLGAVRGTDNLNPVEKIEIPESVHTPDKCVDGAARRSGFQYGSHPGMGAPYDDDQSLLLLEKERLFRTPVLRIPGPISKDSLTSVTCSAPSIVSHGYGANTDIAGFTCRKAPNPPV